MPTHKNNSLLFHFRRAVLLRDGAGLTDAQLLGLFINERDEAAFEALVRRHGPMVMGTCFRLLGNHHDAEDAFQAAFLVLARKAPSIKPREMVANWLYGVARMTALRNKTLRAKRKSREKQGTALPESATPDREHWNDLRTVIDRELSRLPEKYRAVILLCDLEGKTIKDAARTLKWPQGTVAGRLSRARGMLAKRLAKHGPWLGEATLAATLTKNAQAAVPFALTASTAKAAAVLGAGEFAIGGLVHGHRLILG